MPATSTEVSTTPLRRFFFREGNTDLRQFVPLRVILADCIQDLRFRDVVPQIGCRRPDTVEHFTLPARAFPASREISDGRWVT